MCRRRRRCLLSARVSFKVRTCDLSSSHFCTSSPIHSATNKLSPIVSFVITHRAAQTFHFVSSRNKVAKPLPQQYHYYLPSDRPERHSTHIRDEREIRKPPNAVQQRTRCKVRSIPTTDKNRLASCNKVRKRLLQPQPHYFRVRMMISRSVDVGVEPLFDELFFLSSCSLRKAKNKQSR